MKKLLFIFAASILGMVACNEDRVEMREINDFSPISSLSSIRMLTNNQIDSIGYWHNFYLHDVNLSSFDWQGANIEEDIKNAFLNMNVSFGLSQTEKGNYLDFIDNYNANIQQLENTLSNEAMIIINDAINFIEQQITVPTYATVQSEISLLKTSAELNLIGEDLDATLIFLSVLDKSCHFWTDIADGGQGGLPPNATVPRYEEWWKRCLLADAAAATTVFTGIGLTLLATPPTFAALCMAVGWSSACASAWACVW